MRASRLKTARRVVMGRAEPASVTTRPPRLSSFLHGRHYIKGGTSHADQHACPSWVIDREEGLQWDRPEQPAYPRNDKARSLCWSGCEGPPGSIGMRVRMLNVIPAAGYVLFAVAAKPAGNTLLSGMRYASLGSFSLDQGHLQRLIGQLGRRLLPCNSPGGHSA